MAANDETDIANILRHNLAFCRKYQTSYDENKIEEKWKNIRFRQILVKIEGRFDP